MALWWKVCLLASLCARPRRLFVAPFQTRHWCFFCRCLPTSCSLNKVSKTSIYFSPEEKMWFRFGFGAFTEPLQRFPITMVDLKELLSWSGNGLVSFGKTRWSGRSGEVVISSSQMMIVSSRLDLIKGTSSELLWRHKKGWHEYLELPKMPSGGSKFWFLVWNTQIVQQRKVRKFQNKNNPTKHTFLQALWKTSPSIDHRLNTRPTCRCFSLAGLMTSYELMTSSLASIVNLYY